MQPGLRAPSTCWDAAGPPWPWYGAGGWSCAGRLSGSEGQIPCSSFLAVHPQRERSHPCHTLLCPGALKAHSPLRKGHTPVSESSLSPCLPPVCSSHSPASLENSTQSSLLWKMGVWVLCVNSHTTKAVRVLNKQLSPKRVPAWFGSQSPALLPFQSHKWGPLAFPKPPVTFHGVGNKFLFPLQDASSLLCVTTEHHLPILQAGPSLLPTGRGGPNDPQPRPCLGEQHVEQSPTLTQLHPAVRELWGARSSLLNLLFFFACALWSCGTFQGSGTSQPPRAPRGLPQCHTAPAVLRPGMPMGDALPCP